MLKMHQQQDPSTLTRTDLLKRAFLTTATSTFAFLLNKQPSFAAEEDTTTTTTPAAADTPAAATPPTEAAAPAKSVKTAYDYAIPYNGERVPLEKFRGKAVVVCNAKSDDPEALNQMPALAYLNGKHSKEGLKVWVFTTEQG